MIREELYNKTVGILVGAYFNDTLEHTNCHACAVGNMVAANMGIELERKPGYGIRSKGSGYGQDPYKNAGLWFSAIGLMKVLENRITDDITLQVKATGYSIYELAMIEYAFETTERGSSVDEWMFNGLMDVIDVLDKIHQNTDVELTKITKQRFLKTDLSA
jgi:hypothetical protein